MLTPVGEHELLVFWIQLAVLLAVGRGLGGLLGRFGQPAVVGELGAGLILGPSVLGRIAPGLAERLFPGHEVESALLLAVSWLGIVFLLAVTGFETDLGLLRRLGRASAGVSIGSLVLPLALGSALGMVLPDALIGDGTGRTTFAAFMAVALSISALPVVAKILGDMRLMRRNFGQITVAAGMVNDLVGWLLLGALTGIVHTGGFDVGQLAGTLLGLAVFILAAFTIGQRGVDRTLRRARAAGDGSTGPLTVVVLTVFVAGAITHALGMEAVIGAFVAGIVLSRSRFLPHESEVMIERMSSAVFAPIFFATAGLYVDMGALARPGNLLATVAIIALAAIAKLAGSYVGGRVSHLSSTESLAIGIGLNARGAMEIVLATIGLRLGVLNEASYTAVVIMAMVTSMAAPPLLRPVLRRLKTSPEEAKRLEREETLEASVIAKARNALLPTRGGANSAIAGRLLDLVLQPEAHVTVLTIVPPEVSELDDGERDDPTVRVAQAFDDRATDERREIRDDPVQAILDESRLGYDLVALGLNEDFRGTHTLSDRLRSLLSQTRTPVLLVRRGSSDDEFRRVLVPVSGTVPSRAAEELAYTLASRVDAEVDVVHVVARHDADPHRTGIGQLSRARTLAERFGRSAAPVLRVGQNAYEQIVTAAWDRSADLVVLGAQLRTTDDGQPFLGYSTEYVLEHAPGTVAVVVFPVSEG